MIKVLTGEQMRNIDKKAIEDLKIPGLILMENAGRAVCEQTLEIIDEIKIENPGVLVICGKGNNGGDGFVAARHLVQNNIQATVVSLHEESDLSGDALTNHNILKSFAEINYYEEMDLELLQNMLIESDIVIDAIIGTGLKSEIKGQVKDIIASINEYSEGYIISVDVPSGINATTGQVMGCAVVADYTITFFAPKLGSILYPGSDHSGEIIVSDISIPDFLEEEEEHNINLITSHYAGISLPYRPEDSNKGTFGSVFNIAGSGCLIGAAYMSAYSSLVVGAGYSVLATPESLVPIFASMTPEIVYVPLKETQNISISQESISIALDKSQKCNVFLIGPGIGTDPSTIDFIAEFTQELTDRGLTAIFDADALNCFSKMERFALPVNSIITPHPMELSRLLNISVEDIQKDRIKSARQAAEQFNTIVVLKGVKTIIAEPDGSIYINPTGNSGLAKAGTGDVLSGMIAGFAAQSCDLTDAAILGAYFHGLAADLAVKDLTEYSLTATKLIDYIPKAIKEIY
ncbi:MAG: NAD(P)H-hydrate dehydratase [Candidatus Gastranaerophilales bacterium]|nr:NAD(P)H-hydrate dehydratase [Candidatus Gastranaerophilales bacterium]